MPSLRKSKHSPCRDKVGAGLRQTGPLAQLNRAFDYGSKGYRFESCGDHKDARLLNTINKSRICFAELAQLVERWLPKPKVTSSSLAFRSQKKRSYSFGDTASSFVCQALTCGKIAFCPPKKHLRGQSVLFARFVHHKGFSVDSPFCLHVLSTEKVFPWMRLHTIRESFGWQDRINGRQGGSGAIFPDWCRVR